MSRSTVAPDAPRAGGLPLRAVLDPELDAENKCKWKALNKLFTPGDEEWEKAASAPSWDSPAICARIKAVLDTAWAEEKAKMARRQAEENKEMERVAKQRERVERRYEENKSTRDFLKKNGLTPVHERSTPKEPDPLAAENPLSLEYEGRARRERKESEVKLSARSPPPPAVLKKAFRLGIDVVVGPPHKREKARAETAAAVKAAEEALAEVPPELVEALLAKVAAGKAAGKAAGSGSGGNSAAAKKPAKVGDNDAEAHQAYYLARLKEINDARKKAGRGALNSKSRGQLLRQCQVRYKKGGEQGFAGTGLQTPVDWKAPYINNTESHPPAEEDDEEDSGFKGDETEEE